MKVMSIEYTTDNKLLLSKLKEVASQPEPTYWTKEYDLWFTCREMINFPESNICGLVNSGEVIAVCSYTDRGDHHYMGNLVSFRKGAGRKLFEEYIKRNNYPRVYTEPINRKVEELFRYWGFRSVDQYNPKFKDYWGYLVYKG